MKDIAVIIPTYKAHDTIRQTLMSVAIQKAVSFKVYISVDGEEQGSYDYLDNYLGLDTEILYNPVNGGCGVARQYGIDRSEEPFMCFIDADDTFLSTLALYYMHKPFVDERNVLVSCDFLEELKNHDIHVRQNDMVWMHGKMYRRSFIDKYHIRFNETRANEDVGWNTQCQCFANEKEQIFLSKDVVYMWQWREGSTVRVDNNAYAFNESIDGYVINKIDAFKKVLEQKPLDEPIQFFMMSGFMHMFKKYLLAMLKAPKQMKHVLKWSKKYYHTIYPQLDPEFVKKAEFTILTHTGLNKPEHYEELQKWKALLNQQPKNKYSKLPAYR